MPPVEIVVKHGDRKLKFELEEKKLLEVQLDIKSINQSILVFHGIILGAIGHFILSFILFVYFETGNDNPFMNLLRLPNMIFYYVGALVTGRNTCGVVGNMYHTLAMQPIITGGNNSSISGIVLTMLLGVIIVAAIASIVTNWIYRKKYPEKTVDLDRLKPTL